MIFSAVVIGFAVVVFASVTAMICVIVSRTDALQASRAMPIIDDANPVDAFGRAGIL